MRVAQWLCVLGILGAACEPDVGHESECWKNCKFASTCRLLPSPLGVGDDDDDGEGERIDSCAQRCQIASDGTKQRLAACLSSKLDWGDSPAAREQSVRNDWCASINSETSRCSLAAQCLRGKFPDVAITGAGALMVSVVDKSSEAKCPDMDKDENQGGCPRVGPDCRIAAACVAAPAAQMRGTCQRGLTLNQPNAGTTVQPSNEQDAGSKGPRSPVTDLCMALQASRTTVTLETQVGSITLDSRTCFDGLAVDWTAAQVPAGLVQASLQIYGTILCGTPPGQPCTAPDPSEKSPRSLSYCITARGNWFPLWPGPSPHNTVIQVDLMALPTIDQLRSAVAERSLSSGGSFQLCETGEMCTDGKDNDQDGQLDCSDQDCRDICERSERGRCTDQLDNDHDGFVDCKDLDCNDSVNCQAGPAMPLPMQGAPR